ncbi:MAG TPA: phage major capsid protein [Thermoguttaceae bacterium]|nr:phage major capsid protein [Thermoguttaceae bacterium]
MKVDIEKLRKERAAELDAAKAIAAKAKEEDRDLTDEELATVEAHTAKSEQLRAEGEALEAKQRKQQAALAALETEDGQAQKPLVRVDPSTGKSAPKIINGEDGKTWSGFGEYLFKVRESAMNPATTDRRLAPEAAAPGMRGDIDSEGGFLVPGEYRSTIVERIYSMGEILSRVKAAGMAFSLTGNSLKIPTVAESSRANGSRWGAVRHYWVAETGSITDSEMRFGELDLTLKKVACLGYVTEEMIEDFSASGSLLMNAFVNELTFGVEDAIVNGNGSGKPLGLLNANCRVDVTKETNQTANTLWGPNVVKMWARMYAPCRKTSVWLINQDVEPQLWGLTLEGRYGSASTSADGIPLYHPAGSQLNSGSYGILMGRPVIPVEYCPVVGDSGDIILFDPASYVLVDKVGGVKSASSIHVRFTTDERTFRVTYRVDGQPTWPSALTPFSAGDTLSPIVTVADRA